ncbi:MAG TPA: hypothetical protein VFV99_18165 [Kofleriaceae bacterium]|nr:hypothetical protein [Kofleriaceae bacterium]
MDTRALIACLLVACTGPKPHAEVVTVAPSPVPGHERVTLAVRNDGRHGEVTLEITLRGASGSVLHDTHHIDVQADERISVVVDIAAPADAYTATVEAQYPD